MKMCIRQQWGGIFKHENIPWNADQALIFKQKNAFFNWKKINLLKVGDSTRAELKKY